MKMKISISIAVFLSSIIVAAAIPCGCDQAICCSRHGNCGLGPANCGSGCREGPCYKKGGQDCICGTRCCSQWGYCGDTEAYCGFGCRNGSCWKTPSGPDSYRPEISSPSGIVTPQFFDTVAARRRSEDCAGNGFYTRDGFLKAAAAFPQFGAGGSANDSSREVAAFFAHVAHDTRNLCDVEEAPTISPSNYCDETYAQQYPCNANKAYYGRGPLKMAWNFNYGPAGKSIGFDGLNSPETVSSDAVISFKTALWYWIVNAREDFLAGKGFGSTIKALKGDSECNGADPEAVAARAKLYVDYCRRVHVDPGTAPLTC